MLELLTPGPAQPLTNSSHHLKLLARTCFAGIFVFMNEEFKTKNVKAHTVVRMNKPVDGGKCAVNTFEDLCYINVRNQYGEAGVVSGCKSS